MDDKLIRNFELERDRGLKASKAYEDFFKPFIEEKRIVIFEVFSDLSVEDSTKLMECKRQLMAVEALDLEIRTIIDAGKVASQQLSLLPMDKY